MQKTFYKYQATGNDFILLDNRPDIFPKKDTKTISRLCHRRFGIGADGLILLETDKSTDFRMTYFNADGREGSMCGNGGRCVVAFARKLGIIGNNCSFEAVDGMHRAHFVGDRVALLMRDVVEIHLKPRHLWLDTGSPHHVQLWEHWDELDVRKEGERLRYGLYGKKGSNINFVKPLGTGRFEVRTYERGVEDETYSCGTGVTAVAVGMHELGLLQQGSAQIETRGGALEVRFAREAGRYTDIWLEGPCEHVYTGTLE